MTLFNIVTFDEDYNFSDHNVMARTWREAVDIYFYSCGSVPNIDRVEYADIITEDTYCGHFVDGAFVLTAPKLPRDEIAAYLDSLH